MGVAPLGSVEAAEAGGEVVVEFEEAAELGLLAEDAGEHDVHGGEELLVGFSGGAVGERGEIAGGGEVAAGVGAFVAVVVGTEIGEGFGHEAGGVADAEAVAADEQNGGGGGGDTVIGGFDFGGHGSGVGVGSGMVTPRFSGGNTEGTEERHRKGMRE